jgi:hypothetical protein
VGPISDEKKNDGPLAYTGHQTRNIGRYIRINGTYSGAQRVHEGKLKMLVPVCLRHDVTIRSGPDSLPTRQLRRRLVPLSRWHPPAPGHRLFPRAKSAAASSFESEPCRACLANHLSSGAPACLANSPARNSGGCCHRVWVYHESIAMKKSVAVRLTVVAAVGIAARAQPRQDPCSAATFNEQACQAAVQNRGYCWNGRWVGLRYHYAFPYYYDAYLDYVSNGGLANPAPVASCGPPHRFFSGAQGISRAGFG